MTVSSPYHNITVLGASYAGLGVAHGLLKAIPSLESQTGKKYKVTIIANSDRFWFVPGAPRAMLKPYPTSIDDSFPLIKPGFAQYPSDSWEFIHAQVTGLDPNRNQVSIDPLDSNEKKTESTSSFHYDTLIIAIGSTGDDPLYSLQGGYLKTYNAYKEVHTRLPSANSVMVVGGGAAGTETAGELGHLYGKTTSSPKDITILSGTSRLLAGLRPAIGARAEEILNSKGVKTIHNVRVQSQKKLADGKTDVTLTDGSTRTVDLLFVATGRVAASSFLPKDLLDDKGQVITDEYLRVRNVASAYATGDIVSIAPMGLFSMFALVPTTVHNVIADLGGREKAKEWKPWTTKESQLVPIGPEAGVGALFGWWLPSFAVKMIKSKHFFFPNVPKIVNGTA